MTDGQRVKKALLDFAKEWNGSQHDAVFLIPCQASQCEPGDLRISFHVEVCEKVDDEHEHTRWRPLGGIYDPPPRKGGVSKK